MNNFTTKYDTSGNKIWAKRCGTNSTGSIKGINIDSSDNIYITGGIEDNLDGNTAQGRDIFLVKFNTSGDKL